MEQVMNFVSLAWPFLVLVGIMYFSCIARSRS